MRSPFSAWFTRRIRASPDPQIAKQDFTLDEILAVGLIKKPRPPGPLQLFRNRVKFPVGYRRGQR
jgi:DNA primase